MKRNPINNIVRNVVVLAGWVDDASRIRVFNDKNRTETQRRLAYMVNGWPVPEKMKEQIVNDVEVRLKEQKIDYTSVQWTVSVCHYRGAYDKLVIRVPM